MKMYNFIYPQWSWVRIPVCWGSIGYSVSGTWDWTPASVGRIPCSSGPRPGSSARQSPPPACPHTQTSCTPTVYINTRIYIWYYWMRVLWWTQPVSLLRHCAHLTHGYKAITSYRQISWAAVHKVYWSWIDKFYCHIGKGNNYMEVFHFKFKKNIINIISYSYPNFTD